MFKNILKSDKSKEHKSFLLHVCRWLIALNMQATQMFANSVATVTRKLRSCIDMQIHASQPSLTLPNTNLWPFTLCVGRAATDHIFMEFGSGILMRGLVAGDLTNKNF